MNLEHNAQQTAFSEKVYGNHRVANHRYLYHKSLANLSASILDIVNSNLKKNPFLFTSYPISTLPLCHSIKALSLYQSTVSLSKHCLSIKALSLSKHCLSIKALSLYQSTVSLSKHCLSVKALSLCQNTVSIKALSLSKHCLSVKALSLCESTVSPSKHCLSIKAVSLYLSIKALSLYQSTVSLSLYQSTVSLSKHCQYKRSFLIVSIIPETGVRLKIPPFDEILQPANAYFAAYRILDKGRIHCKSLSLSHIE